MKSSRSQARRSDPAPDDNVVRLFQSETAEIEERREPLRTRMTIYVLAAMVVSMIIVAISFQIDRVVTSAAGLMVTTEATIVVQALDASIIKTLDVKVGQQVKKGQLLATLDPTFTTADVLALQTQIAAFDAQIGRCEAELAGRPYQPPSTTDPALAKFGEMQKAYYQQRKEQYEQQIRAYNEQIAQTKATIVKLDNDQSRYGDRVKLAKDVEDMRATLASVQAGSRLQLLQAIDSKTELLRSMEYDRNGLVESQHQLQATIATRDAFVQQWLGQASQELVTARTQRDTALQQLEKATRHKDLVRIDAIGDAIVLTKANVSVGSVLKEGDTLFSLAPMTSPLEAELQVLTRDIGFVRVGDKVTIKFDPFQFVEHGTAEGVVSWISEGAFTTNDNGTPATEPFYKVRVKMTKTDLYGVPKDFRLIPGMTLTGDIHVGTRSLFMYLIENSVKGVSEAMREP